MRVWKARQVKPNGKALAAWWDQINKWRGRECLRYRPSNDVIKPQYALQRLYDAIKGRDYYITTEVGQHQMWAAQFIKFEKPNHWMTSGGLGTMGYGLPAAIGVQIAHPEALVIDVAGEASIMMNIQEMSTAVQYRAAGQGLHHEQPLDGHGAAVAGAAAWRALFRELQRRAAGLREAGRRVRLDRPARRPSRPRWTTSSRR